jgi:hypothetical protein
MGALGVCNYDPVANMLTCGVQTDSPYKVDPTTLSQPSKPTNAPKKTPKAAIAPSSPAGSISATEGSDQPVMDQNWFEQDTWISGIKNKLLAGGAGFLVLMTLLRRRRSY